MADGGERPEQVKVQYRRMRFDFERTGFSRYWHGGSPFKSFFWDALSTAFPPGEKFFIDSARGVRDQIDDPELLEEIAEFCRQEGHHTYHHRKFNQMVGEQGFDVARYERRFARVLGRARRRLGPMGMLTVTMALEHFTAGFAHRYLSDPHLAEGADPNVRALWAWHAAEEAEHKSTCFVIYQRLGGAHRLRVAVMPAAWLLLVLITQTVYRLRIRGRDHVPAEGGALRRRERIPHLLLDRAAPDPAGHRHRRGLHHGADLERPLVPADPGARRRQADHHPGRAAVHRPVRDGLERGAGLPHPRDRPDPDSLCSLLAPADPRTDRGRGEMTAR